MRTMSLVVRHDSHVLSRCSGHLLASMSTAAQCLPRLPDDLSGEDVSQRKLESCTRVINW